MTGTSPDRSCRRCGASLAGKRPHALYCSRSCKVLAACDRRLAADPDYDRRRYAKERERRLAYAAQYWRENPEATRVAKRNRKARKVGNGGYVAVTAKEWVRLVSRWGGCCAYCGAAGVPLHMDHVVPLSKGGRHAPSNILPACGPCNMGKHDSFLSVWRYRRGGGSHLTPQRRPHMAA